MLDLTKKGCTQRREVTQTVFVDTRADPRASAASVRPAGAERAYDVTLTPRDAFGNHVGPGRGGEFRCEPAERCRCDTRKTRDHGDGSYTLRLELADGVAACTIEGLRGRFEVFPELDARRCADACANDPAPAPAPEQPSGCLVTGPTSGPPIRLCGHRTDFGEEESTMPNRDGPHTADFKRLPDWVRLARNVGLLAGCAFVLIAFATARTAPRLSGPLFKEAYVWQRRWTPAVSAAVAESRPRLAGIVVLGAEVGWEDGRPVVSRVAVPAAATAGTRAGLAIRIAPFRADFGAASAGLSEIAASTLASARAGAWEPSELQLDFDCPTARLEDYARWVRAVRARVAPTPVTVTVLPTWLRASAFRNLLAVADGWVLQVHSLRLPRFGERGSLCDVSAVRRAVEEAGRFGQPFRVALPTYGYAVRFGGREDSAQSATASIRARRWDTQSRVEVGADPKALAGLIAAWTADRPSALAGVIWYRLPVAGDVRNWSWATLERVMAGEMPTSAADVDMRHAAAGLVEIDIVNVGDVDLPRTVRVAVRWQGGELVASDALGGSRVVRRKRSEIRLSSWTNGLRPGERRAIAWLRFDGDVVAKAHAFGPPA